MAVSCKQKMSNIKDIVVLSNILNDDWQCTFDTLINVITLFNDELTACEVDGQLAPLCHLHPGNDLAGIHKEHPRILNGAMQKDCSLPKMKKILYNI